MCNAYRHPPDCTCGFGGEGHAGRRRAPARVDSRPVRSILQNFSYVPRIHPAYESYINPNAKCPVCGATVFFYQSPDGGRVFFNELGPPWPKHPCTDNGSVPASLHNYGADSVARTPSCMRKGWDPLYILGVLDRRRYVYEIKCRHRDLSITLYFTKRRSRHPSYIDNITRDTIAFLKRSENRRHEVSLLSRSGTPIQVSAFSRQYEANEEGRILASRERTQARKGADYCVGTVKWFDTTKGYGYIRLDNNREDIFMHLSTLSRCGIASLYEGQRVRVVVRASRKGREAQFIKVF